MTSWNTDVSLARELLATIRDYPDFPKSGVVFKDICPVLAHPDLFSRTIKALATQARSQGTQQIVGIEARGFLVGLPLAVELGVPFVPARKKGKLPGILEAESYALEYGVDHIEVQRESLKSGLKTLVVDDVIATGGTAGAIGRMLARTGTPLAGFLFLIEIEFLQGRAALQKVAPGASVDALLKI